MKVQIIETIDFDEKKELDRLKKAFAGGELNRQLKIYRAFIEGDLERVAKLYDKLPYNDFDECSEQEYTGIFINNILGEKFIMGKEIKFIKNE